MREEEWKCEYCSFENQREEQRCVVCGKGPGTPLLKDYPRGFHLASELELGFCNFTERVIVLGPEDDELEQFDKADRENATMSLAGEEKLSWGQARLALDLMDLSYSRESAVEAARQCSTLDQAEAFLNRCCPVCDRLHPESKMEKMYFCEHSACVLCAQQYFTHQIRERSLLDMTCPVCSQPRLGHSVSVHDYFATLDAQFRKLLSEDVYDLLQVKLRDLSLSSDPDFFWCPNCKDSFGFYPDLTNQPRFRCPNCKISFCSNCKQQWEAKHDCLESGRSQKTYVNELDHFLHCNHTTCPSCGTGYDVMRGGCMHLTCSCCKHSWCDGCRKPFYHGDKCVISARCAQRGLHAHHPRSCFYFGRDRDYRKLQQLLQKNGVAYECAPLADSEHSGCPVLENRDDDEVRCGGTAEVDLSGLCVKHYREYLSRIISAANLDPVDIMDTQDLVSELDRNDVRVPEKEAEESDAHYYHRLKNFVVEALPFESSSRSGS